jgi:hypothetical protein
MAEKFIGVKMTKEFNWRYPCEHCGKTIEVQSSFMGQYGQKVRKMTPSGTTFNLTEQGKQSYLAQARSDFPKLCENTLLQWNNGIYPDFIIAKYGKCSYCRKYQHWNKKIAELSISSLVGNIIASIFIAPVISMVLTLIISIFVKGKALLIIGIILSVILMIICIFAAIIERKELVQQKAELKNKPKQFPKFVSWGNTSENIISYA